jgi:flagellar motor protein MotB
MRHVESYLEKGAALETFWSRPLTGDQLQAETRRIVRDTKHPDLLRELLAALDDDPFLIAECPGGAGALLFRGSSRLLGDRIDRAEVGVEALRLGLQLRRCDRRLRLEIEGHTDSVGAEDYNQRLSEQRAGAVRDYLVGEGVAAGTVGARGFGESRPIASNDTAAERQQNRRVEIVVSGEAIGIPARSMN